VYPIEYSEDSAIIGALKAEQRGYFHGKSKHENNFQRATSGKKVTRNLPRTQSTARYQKKEAGRMERRIDQKEREKSNFWDEYHKQELLRPKAPTSTSSKLSPIVPIASTVSTIPSDSQPTFVAPTTFTAPKSQYERELQTALKASATEKHSSGLNYSLLLELSSRELTPEDYEMLLQLDASVEKKTVSANVLESLNETVAEETISGNCTICFCDFEAGDKIKTLNCSHNFHVDCVTEWLTKHSQSCPLCNTKVV